MAEWRLLIPPGLVLGLSKVIVNLSGELVSQKRRGQF
jgi:hypothetical protein